MAGQVLTGSSVDGMPHTWCCAGWHVRAKELVVNLHIEVVW